MTAQPKRKQTWPRTYVSQQLPELIGNLFVIAILGLGLILL